MKIYLDSMNPPWNSRAIYYLSNILNIDFVLDKHYSNTIKEGVDSAFHDYEIGDIYLAKIETSHFLRRRKEYDAICDKFRGKVWPDSDSLEMHGHKKSISEFLKSKNYPMPKTYFCETEDDVNKFLEKNNLNFPIVSKILMGSGGKGVVLCNSLSDIDEYPRIVQEFCSNNDGDYRIHVIGDKVTGFYRLNRKGDFRASGSIHKKYPDSLPTEIVDLCYRICQENNFICMCFDILKDNEGKWVILEMACSWPMVFSYNNYYYDMADNRKKINQCVFHQDFLVEEVIKKYS